MGCRRHHLKTYQFAVKIGQRTAERVNAEFCETLGAAQRWIGRVGFIVIVRVVEMRNRLVWDLSGGSEEQRGFEVNMRIICSKEAHIILPDILEGRGHAIF